MEREERVITNACVNYIVPLAIVGLIANFIPYLMVIVPVDEEDVCWFYFLTRSPYQLDYVDNKLYYSAMVMRYVIIATELLVLIYYNCKIRKRKLNMIQINISWESQLITSQWIVFTILNVIFKIIITFMIEGNWADWLQILQYITKALRNTCTAGILYYYSVYLINKDSKSQQQEDDADLQKNLGTFAIEDFDVAMKSKNPLKQFRTYVISQPTHYQETLLEAIGVKQVDTKVGNTFFQLFQLITIFNLTSFNINAQKRKMQNDAIVDINDQEDYSKNRDYQRKTVIEIIRFIDDCSSQCFPQMDRNNFLETFKGIIVKRNVPNGPDF